MKKVIFSNSSINEQSFNIIQCIFHQSHFFFHLTHHRLQLPICHRQSNNLSFQNSHIFLTTATHHFQCLHFTHHFAGCMTGQLKQSLGYLFSRFVLKFTLTTVNARSTATSASFTSWTHHLCRTCSSRLIMSCFDINA